ncbi:MAG: hypothetical protein KKI08_13180 [Armatimonadetes bacterium]|nr:hypothetical protein [Armatimonadota bacterium]
MTSKLGLIIGMAGMMALLGACSDDSGTKPKVDQGPIRIDTGGGHDKGGGGDTGTAADQTCSQLLVCASKCSDATCIAACVATGTAKAKTDFGAVDACLTKEGTGTGACAADCADPKDPKCTPCLQTACKSEFDVCAGGTGQPDAGFGDLCDQQTPCTNAAMQCTTLQGGTAGFCTKKCDSLGPICPGAPAGLAAYCFIKDQANQYWCGFICKIGGQTYPCPTHLTCGAENQGQAACQ